MRYASSFRHALVAAVGLALLAGPGSPATADQHEIAAGFDLFETADGSTFGVTLDDLGLPAKTAVTFTGVPLGSHAFPEVGEVETGPVDTIVQRLKPGGVRSDIPIELTALQLVSTNTPIPFYVTLSRGLPSTGVIRPTETSSEGGSFTAELTVNYDVRVGQIDGPVVLSNTVVFTADTVFGRNSDVARELEKVAMAHRHGVRPTGPQIERVNFLLNGFDTSSDFFPGRPLG